MANPGLPLPAIQNLPAAFWSTEAQVNAVWLGLLARSFHGDPGVLGGTSWIIAPEGRPGDSTSGRRADLLVSRLIPGTGAAPASWATATVDNVLHFEGKGGAASSTFDDVRAQVLEWMESRGERLTGTGLKYSIGAKGRRFMFFVYNATSRNVQYVKMDRVAGPPAHWAVTRTDSEQDPHDLTDSVTVLAGFLDFVIANPHPPANNTVIRDVSP